MSNGSDDVVSSETLMLGYPCIKAAEGLEGQVEILDRFGLPNRDIAAICGAAVQSVRNARVRYRKLEKASKKGGS